MVDISQNATGRLLFEKKSDPIAILVPSGAALAALVMSPCFVFLGPPKDMSRSESILVGFACIFASIALSIVAYVIWKTSVLVYENCIYKITPLRCTQLYYDQVEELSYSISREYAGQLYVGTQYFFNLYSKKKSVEFRITLKKDRDQELDILLTFISENIAKQLLDQLAEKEKAPWGENIRFANDGLEYRFESLWHTLPYNLVGNCEIDRGIFYLRAIDSNFPVAHANTIAPNFFPGLIVFKKMCNPEAPSKPWVFPGENN